MIYRVGTVEDWPNIVQFLIDTEYFLAVNPADIKGTWIVAEYEGKLRGVLWFFGWPPNVYLDYLAATSPRIAARLLAKTEVALKEAGVRFVRANIANANPAMLRMANWLGARLILGHVTAFKEIK